MADGRRDERRKQQRTVNPRAWRPAVVRIPVQICPDCNWAGLAYPQPYRACPDCKGKDLRLQMEIKTRAGKRMQDLERVFILHVDGRVYERRIPFGQTTGTTRRVKNNQLIALVKNAYWERQEQAQKSRARAQAIAEQVGRKGDAA